MKYVKKSAQVLLVDDSEVSKYTEKGFTVFVPGEPDINDPVISDLVNRAAKLKLKLPDGMTVDEVRAAVEQAEADKAQADAEKAAAKAAVNSGTPDDVKAGAENGDNA